MKIALLEPLRVSEKRIDELAKPIKEMGHEFIYYSEKTTDPKELARRSEDCDIVIIGNNQYPEEVISQSKKLKLIDVAFTGIDHVDVDAAKDHGVMIANASGYADQSVAEMAVGLTLDVYRRISFGNDSIRKQPFSGPYQGREIYGKTVGIIGTGSIGIKTARLFKAFGANLLGYNRTKKEEATALGLTYVPLDQLLAESDIVSIHLPLSEDTKGLLSKEKLEKMKSTAVLINCARGPVVDNQGLAELLNNNKIAGAGIDVFDMEPPLPADYPLLDAKHAVLTPHTAYLTDEAMEKRAKIAFENVIAYLNGDPQNILVK